MQLSFPLTTEIEERFFSFVVKEKNDNPCWIWHGHVDERRYARFYGQIAHRVIFQHTYGPLKKNFYVTRCPLNFLCINPEHLSSSIQHWGFKVGHIPPHKGKTRKRIPMKERFYSFVRIQPPPSTCWQWTGATVPDGYGILSNPDTRRPVRAHVFSYELHIGPIPAGLQVLHKCDNPPCVNPKHLYAGTHARNMKDASERKRFPNRKGEKHPRVKLTEEKVRTIWQRLKNGESMKALGKEYRVAEITIWHIRKGNSWRHLNLVSEIEN